MTDLQLAIAFALFLSCFVLVFFAGRWSAPRAKVVVIADPLAPAPIAEPHPEILEGMLVKVETVEVKSGREIFQRDQIITDLLRRLEAKEKLRARYWKALKKARAELGEHRNNWSSVRQMLDNWDLSADWRERTSP